MKQNAGTHHDPDEYETPVPALSFGMIVAIVVIVYLFGMQRDPQ